MRRLLTQLLMGCALLATSCAPMATYPPIEGSMDLGAPGFEPIPTLMATSIRFAHDQYNDGQDDLVINLPPRTSSTTYAKVIDDLGGGRPMTSADNRAYHVQQVRVRGLDASVDLIYPRGDEGYELVTIQLRKSLLGPYRVTDTRLWRIHVDVPGPHFLATPEQKIALPPPPAEPAPARPEPPSDGK